jgi:hypothetical protein
MLDLTTEKFSYELISESRVIYVRYDKTKIYLPSDSCKPKWFTFSLVTQIIS